MKTKGIPSNMIKCDKSFPPYCIVFLYIIEKSCVKSGIMIHNNSFQQSWSKGLTS